MEKWRGESWEWGSETFTHAACEKQESTWCQELEARGSAPLPTPNTMLQPCPCLSPHIPVPIPVPRPLQGLEVKTNPWGITFRPTPGWEEQGYLFLALKPPQRISDAVVAAGAGWAAASVTAPACSRALPARSRPASLLNKDERLKIEPRPGFGQVRQPFPGPGAIQGGWPASVCEGEPSCLRGRVPRVGPNRAAAGEKV